MVASCTYVSSKVHKGSFGCGCCSPRQKRHRSDLRELHGFRSYHVLDGGKGVGVAVMIRSRTEKAANAANDKILAFVQASLLDLNLGDPEIIAGEVLVKIEF